MHFLHGKSLKNFHLQRAVPRKIFSSLDEIILCTGMAITLQVTKKWRIAVSEASGPQKIENLRM
jgi:hypothetical protein